MKREVHDMKKCSLCDQEARDTATGCEPCGQPPEENKDDMPRADTPEAELLLRGGTGSKWASKYGWGWIVLLLLYGQGASRMQIDSSVASLASMVGASAEEGGRSAPWRAPG